MLYVERRPAPPLSLLVDTLWYTRDYDVPHTRERVFPNGTIQLVICLADSYILDCDTGERMSPALIAGVRNQYATIDTAGLREMIGAQFRPGGFYPLFGIPAEEFTNRDVALEDIWGRGGERLLDELRSARGAHAKLAVLERALGAVCASGAEPHRAVEYAISRIPQAGARVADLMGDIGLSERRFSQLFREHVGVAPKLYCRIRRFQSALREVARGKNVDWSDLALECGYYDQAHFINDFRAFSGLNPTSYVAKRGQWMNHVAG